MNGFRAVALAWTSEISNAGFVSALLVSVDWPAVRLENKTAQLRAANARDIGRYLHSLDMEDARDGDFDDAIPALVPGDSGRDWLILRYVKEDEATPRLDVIPAAPEQEPILANLLELYAHDFSEFHNLELGPDGRFGYKHLSLYWREPGRFPFLVKVNGQLAGLVLVIRGEEGWDMAEFFVVRGYRRRGIGSGVAHEVWRRFPGRWQVRVMESNRAAHRFWTQAISEFVGEAIRPLGVEDSGEHWHVFTFESRPVA
jgi:predicted acetyltransferase